MIKYLRGNNDVILSMNKLGYIANYPFGIILFSIDLKKTLEKLREHKLEKKKFLFEN